MKPTEAQHLGGATLYTSDALEVLRTLPDESVQACITSPPYWGLRDYGVDGQIGLEPTIDEYVEKLVKIFREIFRVLRGDGTLWLNMGDSYITKPHGTIGANTYDPKYPGARNRGHGFEKGEPSNAAAPNRKPIPGLKHKDMVGIPWRVAFALQADGWWLRQDIIWWKPNAMPESVRDRCTKAHEYLFILSKSERYYWDYEAMQEPASPDTHARYARGRSDSHKYADGGPGNQTITKSFEHMRKPGIGPKAKIPSGWDTRPGNHRENSGRYRVKQNESFQGATAGPRETRNKRSVWAVPSAPFKGAHFATFPPDLIRPCVMAGCPAGGIVLDPFSGSGTTGMVALEEGRRYIGIELSPEYQALAVERITPAAQQGRLIA